MLEMEQIKITCRAVWSCAPNWQGEIKADPKETYGDKNFLFQFEGDFIRPKLFEVNWNRLGLCCL